MSAAKKKNYRLELDCINEYDFEKVTGPEVEYIGEGDFAPFVLKELGRSGVNVVRFLTTSEPKTDIYGVDVKVCNNAELEKEIGSSGDYSLMMFIGEKISEEAVRKNNGRFLNLHPSLLPEFRGVADPMKEMIKQKRRYGGVTLHEVDPEFDSGSIYGMRLYGLPNGALHDSTGSLERKTSIGYIYGAIPEAAKLTKEILESIDLIIPTAPYQFSLEPKTIISK